MKTLDRHDIQRMLEITSKQFLRLSRSPQFPQPVRKTRFEVRWREADIMVVKEKLDAFAKRRLKVPDVLYRWDDLLPRDDQYWPRQWKPLRRRR